MACEHCVILINLIIMYNFRAQHQTLTASGIYGLQTHERIDLPEADNIVPLVSKRSARGDWKPECQGARGEVVEGIRGCSNLCVQGKTVKGQGEAGIKN